MSCKFRSPSRTLLGAQRNISIFLISNLHAVFQCKLITLVFFFLPEVYNLANWMHTFDLQWLPYLSRKEELRFEESLLLAPTYQWNSPSHIVC